MDAVLLADFILHNENAIRQAVKEERESLSLLGASNIETHKGDKVSDRTAAAALKIGEELPAVILDGGGRIERPESWIAILDEVRAAARGCNEPLHIFAAWGEKYGGEMPRLVPVLSPLVDMREMYRDIISWIRFHVLTRAKGKGLVLLSGDEIMESVEKARAESPAPMEEEKPKRRKAARMKAG